MYKETKELWKKESGAGRRQRRILRRVYNAAVMILKWREGFSFCIKKDKTWKYFYRKILLRV